MNVVYMLCDGVLGVSVRCECGVICDGVRGVRVRCV